MQCVLATALGHGAAGAVRAAGGQSRFPYGVLHEVRIIDGVLHRAVLPDVDAVPNLPDADVDGDPVLVDLGVSHWLKGDVHDLLDAGGATVRSVLDRLDDLGEDQAAVQAVAELTPVAEGCVRILSSPDLDAVVDSYRQVWPAAGLAHAVRLTMDTGFRRNLGVFAWLDEAGAELPNAPEDGPAGLPPGWASSWEQPWMHWALSYRLVAEHPQADVVARVADTVHRARRNLESNLTIAVSL